MLAIEIDKLVKQYRNGVRALDALSLNVRSGEIFTLLGPNGAGKSTLINILTTYFKPTSGNVRMLGKDLFKDPSWARHQIACVAQRTSIDEHLSLMGNMMFQSRLYKVDSQVVKKRIKTLIDNFELSEYLKYPIASYSGGVKRRLDIAMNMVSSPKILFLDEPTIGMDVLSRKAMWKLLRKIRNDYGTTIFLTTHYLEEADQLSDNICIMKDGKIIIQGTSESLRSYTQQAMIRIEFSSVEEVNQCKDLLNSTGITEFTKPQNQSLYLGVKNISESFTTINKWLLDHHVEFNGIEVHKPSLEDAFEREVG
ncbi:ABC transporter ATP-binding protein [Vallitalea okinawensis]|uniref:ABC transporter ATP-binding protein n=1 Tax=Vallitalea okinawensis TaxID=2078660 RepID=UPI000CFDE314|nr:ABC transporter ATP-binding protein [Vallitalea okinawensis]